MLCLLLVVGCAARAAASFGWRSLCMSPDSVVLEIYSARFNFDNLDLTRSSLGTRRRAALPGRGAPQPAGVWIAGGHLAGADSRGTASVAERGHQRRQAATAASSGSPAIASGGNGGRFRRKIPRAKARAAIAGSQTGRDPGIGNLRVCRCWKTKAGHLHGKPYANGQGLLSVKSFPQPDGRVGSIFCRSCTTASPR